MTARSAESTRIKRSSQRQGVWQALKKKKWISVRSIKARGSDSALTARLRDFRKEGRVVECRRFSDGVYRYRLVR